MVWKFKQGVMDVETQRVQKDESENPRKGGKMGERIENDQKKMNMTRKRKKINKGCGDGVKIKIP